MPKDNSEAERVRNLVLVLGDQLDPRSSAFDGFDRSVDAVWMTETPQEAQHVWSSKPRVAMFLSAMRHFRSALRRRRIRLFYRCIEGPDNRGSFAEELSTCVRRCRPGKLLVVEPGAHRVRKSLGAAAKRLSVPLAVRADRSFLCSPQAFSEHAAARKQLRMEYFYREMRRRHRILVDPEGRPDGGHWNYDQANRSSFGKAGPGELPTVRSFPPDPTTREVIKTVNRVFADHPGSLDSFDWPVTPGQAYEALRDFVENRLGSFGPYQDAMWTGRPFLYHSRLSAAMNLKLLDPRDAIAAAARAFREDRAPLNSAEGFIRQVLGWREYVRGVYDLFMPDYLERNALNASAALPSFYWTGRTDAACLREAITQTLRFGYAHHIQRLMITGLFAMLLGVDPKEVHRWYLSVYVDAVEWVELPNTLGMSQYADGGIMASKPYVATGRYIQRMSDYCRRCRFRPTEATGEKACPFTTLYWDFLMRHERLLATNVRMGLQLRNLARLRPAERRGIRAAAVNVRSACQKAL